jgi:hypothetical protein
MAEGQTELEQREQFLRPASLKDLLILCGDERPAVGVDDYLQIFGGVLNVPYNIAVVQEANKPGSVTDSFESYITKVVPLVIAAGLKPGVHSDEHAEHATTINTELIDAAIGCGYGEKRAIISRDVIANPSSGIMDDVKTVDPELLRTEADQMFARKVVEANGRLANRQSFLTTGRRAVLAAIEAGATGAVVNGDHIATVGLLIKREGTRFATREAWDAKLPAYTHQEWVAMAALNPVKDVFEINPRQYEISTGIDAIGTMRALGVTTIELVAA